jgi:osmotically-inducible protein OsmY
MKYRVFALLFSTLLLAGCGSFLSAIGSEPIEDDPGERTMGAKMDDESIETKAQVNINAADEGFKAAHFTVTSYNGFVLIVGQVPDEALRQKASDILRDIRKVRRIYNELEVRGNTSAMTRSSDAWLTTKVKSTFLANNTIEGNRVKVMTENGVVYLMGLVSKTEAERIVDSASGHGGVQKVVRLFEYID